MYAIFAGDTLHPKPSSPRIGSYLQNCFVSEDTAIYNTRSAETYRSELLVYISVSDLRKISNDTTIAMPVIASFAYFASACASRWLEEVSHGGVEEYVDTTEIDDCLASLRRFLEGMVSLTARDAASTDHQSESDWYFELARSELEPLLGNINPKWKNIEFADFAADLEIVRRGSRRPKHGRRPLSHRADADAANELISIWESEFGTTAGRGTSRRTPFYVFRQILSSAKIIFERLGEVGSLRELPDDELTTLRDALFAGEAPVLLRALDANYKPKAKQTQG